ncbi:L,D-transpeptidase [Bradyrhizobium sp. CNPSo 4026]|nr:L,D-transpeptidase [Bradyrhizobium cenepequi]
MVRTRDRRLSEGLAALGPAGLDDPASAGIGEVPGVERQHAARPAGSAGGACCTSTTHGHDTLYRLHGNNEPSTIGKAVSSGCIRLLNQDVIHLASNVANGTSIVVIPDPAMASLTIGGSRAKS